MGMQQVYINNNNNKKYVHINLKVTSNFDKTQWTFTRLTYPSSFTEKTKRAANLHYNTSLSDTDCLQSDQRWTAEENYQKRKLDFISS